MGDCAVQIWMNAAPHHLPVIMHWRIMITARIEEDDTWWDIQLTDHPTFRLAAIADSGTCHLRSFNNFHLPLSVAWEVNRCAPVRQGGAWIDRNKLPHGRTNLQGSRIYKTTGLKERPAKRYQVDRLFGVSPTPVPLARA